MKIFRPGDLGRGVRLVATGSYLPSREVTNQDLVTMGAPLSDADMVKLSGIHARRWVGPHEATSDLAVAAGRCTLERAGIDPTAVERLMVATVSPDHSSPSTACLVHHGLGMREAPALDLVAACSGFLYGLDLAARAVVTGEDPVLLIAADVRSRYLDVTDRATCALFGDGAGGALVASGPVGSGLVAIGLVADGSGAHSIYVPAGGSREPASIQSIEARRHTIRMNDGPQIYLSAVEGMLYAAESLLSSLALSFSDVDWLVPHQANLHIIKRVAWKAKIPLDRVVLNLERVGNISGATVPVALDMALVGGRMKPGDRILMVAAGGGYTGGAALYVADEALLASMAGSR